MNIARHLSLPGFVTLALVTGGFGEGCLPDHDHHHKGWEDPEGSRTCRASSECGTGEYCTSYGLCVTIVPGGGGRVADAGSSDAGRRDGGTGDALGSGGSGGRTTGGATGGTGGVRVSLGTGGAPAASGGQTGVAGGNGTLGVGPAACHANADCATGDCCVSGVCQPNPATPGTSSATPACQFNSDCAGGARCRNGACEPTCTSSAAGACGTGDVCSVGFCVVDPVGGTECVLDSQCPAGASPPLCINGHCHPGCQVDSDCGALDRCLSGVCRADTRPRPSCRVNTDCATAGQSCVGGVCRSACTTSADCCACGPATQCHLGFCVTPGEAAPMCSVATDCADGASCVDAVCHS